MIQIGNKEVDSIFIDNKEVQTITIGGKTAYNKQDNTDYFYVENTYLGSNTITFTTTQNGTPESGTYATSVEYSKDKSTWNTINFDALNPQTITLGQGEKLYLRNDTGVFNFHDVRNGSVDYYTSITSTNTINSGGNTNSLFDYTNMSSVDVSSTVGGLSKLFKQSVNLVNANDIVIPQTTLPDFFLTEMFDHCESLVTTPNLNNIVNMGYASCSQMFGYCYSLVTPPDFNGVTYTGIRSGFSWTFHDCTSLTRTPSFNSLTSIGPYGFNQCFTNCTNLTDIMFDISGINSLPENAFNTSFYNTKIRTGLYLGDVTTIGTSSLVRMYDGCSLLSVVSCPNVSSWETSKTNNWMRNAGSGVSGTKIAYKYSNISIPTSNSGIPSGWTAVLTPIEYFYIENAYQGENTVYLTTTKTGTPESGTYATSVEYSKNKINWITLNLTNATTNIFTLNQGEKVYFRNNSGKWSSYTDNNNNISNTFTSTQSIVAGGELYTLLNHTNRSVGLSNGCFFNLFRGCTTLVTAPDLSFTTMATRCYQSMFMGCTSLATAPILPATTLVNGCYGSMFSDCTSLNSVTTYANDISAYNCTVNWLNNVAATGTLNNLGTATYTTSSSDGIPTGWTEHKIKMKDVVLTPATGTEYSVTANLEWSSSLTWTSAEINISDTDSGSGTRNAYLTFTPSEVVNGVLTTSNNIDVWFSNPDTWFTLTIYNNGTVVDTQYITYTTA